MDPKDNQVPLFRPRVSNSGLSPLGVDLVSFVDEPAIERDFVALNKDEKAKVLEATQKIKLMDHVDTMKQRVIGPALIPDHRIIRYDEKLGIYYIQFDADTIEQIQEKFFTHNFHQRTNAQHVDPLMGNVVVGSWIVDNPENDRSNGYFDEPFPKGTWMIEVKVNDADFFKEEILSGNCRGFSIEGYFDYEFQEFVDLQLSKSKTEATKSPIINKIKSKSMDVLAIFKSVFKRVSKENGIYVINEKEQFTIVGEVPYELVDGAVSKTVLKDGTYELLDGNICTVLAGKASLSETTDSKLSVALAAQVTPKRSREAIVLEIANSADRSPSTIEAVLSGSIETPDANVLDAFAKVLNLDKGTVLPDGVTALNSGKTVAGMFNAALANHTLSKDEAFTRLGVITSQPKEYFEQISNGVIKEVPTRFAKPIQSLLGVEFAPEPVEGKVMKMERRLITAEMSLNLAGFVIKSDNSMVNVDANSGEVWAVVQEGKSLYCNEYLSAGSYEVITSDGTKTLTVREEMFSYKDYWGDTQIIRRGVLDFSNSTIEATDLMPFTRSENMKAALKAAESLKTASNTANLGQVALSLELPENATATEMVAAIGKFKKLPLSTSPWRGAKPNRTTQSAQTVAGKVVDGNVPDVASSSIAKKGMNLIRRNQAFQKMKQKSNLN